MKFTLPRLWSGLLYWFRGLHHFIKGNYIIIINLYLINGKTRSYGTFLNFYFIFLKISYSYLYKYNLNQLKVGGCGIYINNGKII